MRVLITDVDHPWHGHAGEWDGDWERLKIIGTLAARVRFDSGLECFAREGQFQVVAKKAPRRKVRR